MANDEFQLPHSISIEEAPRPAEFLAVSPDVPETFRGAQYHEVKKKAADIQRWRTSADETLIPRRLTQRILDGIIEKIGFSVDRNTPLIERLIETEGQIGGSLFAPQEGILTQRFWLDMPHTAGADDWFYECVDAKGPMRAHYVVTDESVQKFSNGHMVPLVNSGYYNEEAVLVSRIEDYHRAVADFYGVPDDARAA